MDRIDGRNMGQIPNWIEYEPFKSNAPVSPPKTLTKETEKVEERPLVNCTAQIFCASM